MSGIKKYMIVAVLLLFAGGGNLAAQHFIGWRAGYGSGNIRLSPKGTETYSKWGLYNGGITWKYLSPERFVGGVSADLIFMQQGYSHDWTTYVPEVYREPRPQDGEDLRFTRKINSLMLPFMWHPHLYLFKRQMRVFLNVGLTFSYNISSTYSWESDQRDELMSGNYEFVTVRDNRFSYGLAGGGGAGWSFGRWEVFAEFRYYYGFGDIMKNATTYFGNPTRSPIDGMQVSLGMTYRLGKGGILSPVSERVAEKMLMEKYGRTYDGEGMEEFFGMPYDDDPSFEDAAIFEEGFPDSQLADEPVIIQMPNDIVIQEENDQGEVINIVEPLEPHRITPEQMED